MSTADEIRRLVAPVVEDMGLELDHVEFAGGLLRITVDKDGGVDIETLTRASERVSRVLDEEDPIPSRYTLELSSPGLERPLRTPAHYQRFIGSKVSVKTRPEVEGDRRVEGILEDADENGFTVAGRRLAYDEVERTKTVFEWGGQPKPGKAAKSGAARKPDKKKQQKAEAR